MPPARAAVSFVGMVRSLRIAPAVCLLLAACGDDKAASDTAVSATSAATGTDSATGTGTATAAGTATDATGTTGAPFEPIPARGITIERVQANQGVGVDIGLDGVGVEGGDRASYLMQGRIMLIRGFWKFLGEWQPREIEARLTLHYPDGTTYEQSQIKFIDADPFEGDLKRTFYFGLMEDEVVPGIKYEMTLWETQPGQEGNPESDPPPRLPYVGTYPIGIEDSDQQLEIIIVPFSYNDGAGCDTPAENSDETLKLFESYMYSQNPVDRTKISFHEPIAWNQKLSDFNELNEYMSDLRFDEGAGPHVYYFGLVDVCSGGLGGAGGKAYGIPSIPATKGQAYQRVSSGLWLPKNQEWSAETFVHEVGHSQGRLHINCGGAAGYDPNYPYPEGQVGEWGFGVRDFGLRHPAVYKDYMTYCHPTWVGTWGWNKVYPVIKETTKWSYEAPPAPGEDPYGGHSLLVGSVYPDGHSTWHTVPGEVTDEELSATDEVEFIGAGGLVARHPAAVKRQPEGEVINIVVRLPDAWDTITAIKHRSPSTERTIEAKSVKVHHTSRAIKAR